MTNDEIRMTIAEAGEAPTSGARAKTSRFDLEDRTARFGENVIQYARKIPLTALTSPLVSQLIRAGTSVGANYCEADDAGSKKEFRYRISVCRRESRESKYWLRMMAVAVPDYRDEARELWIEAKELNLIFATIHRRSGST